MSKFIITAILALPVAAYFNLAMAQEATNKPVQAIASPAASKPTDTSSFYGLKIGMSEKEIQKLFPKLSFSARGPVRQSSELFHFSEMPTDLYFDKNENAIIDLTLLEDRLVNISVRWLPTSSDSMLLKLEKALGAPFLSRKDKLKTSGGEEFTSATVTWTGDKVSVFYYQHYENIKQSRILFSEKP